MAWSPHGRARARLQPVLVGITVIALTFSGTAGYTVRSGDTLWGIAQRLGVSVGSLASANSLRNPDLIRPGQQLRLPSTVNVRRGGAPTTASVHVVRPGETLMGISIRYGVLMRHIAAASGVRNLNQVFAGQRLRIPGTGAGAPAATKDTALPATARRADIGRMLERTARQYGFKPSFIKAIAYLESGWNPSVRSSAGAVGVMQVLPSTGEFVGRYLVGRRLDLTNPRDNIIAGVAFVDYLWRLTGGNVNRTLAGYYQGLRSVEFNGMFPSTKRYIANVLALRARF